MRIGWPPYRYEAIPDWGSTPSGSRMGPVTAVATDSQDRVYICHRGEPQVLILSPDGEPLGTVGEGLVEDPHGICLGQDDIVYIVDRDCHCVRVFSAEGRLVGTLGTPDRAEPDAPFNHPTAAAVGPEGDLYVADGYGNSRIHVFSAPGALLRSWGEPGTRPGQFKVPHGIAVDSQGTVYVADRENDRVQVFQTDGTHLADWDDFHGPTDVHVGRGDLVYVSDHIPRITILDRAGRVLARGRSFHDTHGISGDSQGNLYIASTAGSCVIKYQLLAE